MQVEASRLAYPDPSLYGTNNSYILFYDETNNVRKLRLRENGLNIKKCDNFVLGGIVLNPDHGELPCISGLRSDLKIPSNAPEIKFELLAKGNFEKILASPKITKFFTWLIEHKIYIHYSNLNILNWAILDIVESISAEEKFSHIQEHHLELKNELYRVASRSLSRFLDILKAHQYPDLRVDNTKKFLQEIYNFVVQYGPATKNLVTVELEKVLLGASKEITDLAFLNNDKAHELIDGFQSFFLNRIASFPNATHFFDEEKTIQEAIANFKIVHNESLVYYDFVDSVQTPGVQLSDVIVGFLGKYFTFIEDTSPKNLINLKGRLTSAQRQNLKLLRTLISRSDKISNHFIHKITTIDSNLKSDYFLLDKKLPKFIVRS